jgi:hypothetical protein
MSRQTILFVRIEDVDQMMGDASLFDGGWLGGSNIHAAVQRHRIERYDFGIEPLGQSQREGGLATSCGSAQE